jgi:hypothetical protein
MRPSKPPGSRSRGPAREADRGIRLMDHLATGPAERLDPLFIDIQCGNPPTELRRHGRLTGFGSGGSGEKGAQG